MKLKTKVVSIGAEALEDETGGALAYWFDIAPERRGEWLEWYQRDHMPSRIGAVFSTGRCYEAIAASRSHMVLFEATTVDALVAPAYLELLRGVTPEDSARRSWYTNTIRATCRVRSRVGCGVGGVLGVLRIVDARCDATELANCLLRVVVPQLAALPRIGAVSAIEYDSSIRGRMDQARVTGHDDSRIDWALLVEAGYEADLSSALDAGQGALRALGLDASNCVSVEQFRLLHTMAKAR